MRPLPPEQIAPVGPWPEGILPVPCLGCRLPLCIHRPGEASPTHLVGTCVGCGARYVIRWTADGTETLIGRLSDSDERHVRARIELLRSKGDALLGGNRAMRPPTHEQNAPGNPWPEEIRVPALRDTTEQNFTGLRATPGLRYCAANTADQDVGI